MNKKYLYLMPMFLFSIAFMSATYYENADSYSSVEGMWQPEGSYIIDGDWGTGANVDWGSCSSADAVLISTYNFTEGSEVSSAIWEVKDKGATRNISIPSDCISSNGIILKVNNDGSCYEIPFEPPVYEYDNTITYSCYDFVLEDWQQLISPIGFYITSYGDVFYEEGLYLELEEIVETETTQGVIRFWNFDKLESSPITGDVVEGTSKFSFSIFFQNIWNWIKELFR